MSETWHIETPTITLRQWYAGLAMQGILAEYAGPECSVPDTKYVAKTALEMADALIAAEQEKSA